MGPAAGTEHSEPRRTARECIMKPAMLLLAFQLLSGSLALCAQAQTGPAQTAESAFAEGKALVEANCADCTGATAERLKEGLRDIERALELGYSDSAAAYRLLGEGYGALAFAFETPGSAEHQRAREAQRASLQRWFEADPANGDALYAYASAIETPADRLAALQYLEQIDPNHLWGQASLAEMEINSGAVPMGLRRLQRAFDAAEGETKREFGERLIEAYEREGLTAEAQAVRDRLAE
jgi:hypothetical protein